MYLISVWSIIRIADNWHNHTDWPIVHFLADVWMYILATIFIIWLSIIVITCLVIWITELYKKITRSDEKFYNEVMKKKYDTIKCLEKYWLTIPEEMKFNKDYDWDFSKEMKIFWHKREVFFTRAYNHSLSSIRIYPIDPYESQIIYSIFEEYFKKVDKIFECGEWVSIIWSWMNCCYIISLQSDWCSENAEKGWFKK